MEVSRLFTGSKVIIYDGALDHVSFTYSCSLSSLQPIYNLAHDCSLSNLKQTKLTFSATA